MEMVNGKEYPLWGQFVDRKDEWIGGCLVDSGDSMDRSMGFDSAQTTITDITLEPNGEDSAFFTVKGEDFSCGFDVKVGGVSGNHNKDGWISFKGYGGHTWRIRENKEKEN